jgi:hypothetical protein
MAHAPRTTSRGSNFASRQDIDHTQSRHVAKWQSSDYESFVGLRTFWKSRPGRQVENSNMPP